MAEAPPKISEYQKEKKKFEPKDPKIWDLLYFGKQLDAFENYDAKQKAKGTEDFSKLEEEWKFRTKDVDWLQKNKLPKELFAMDKDEEPETPPDPDSYLEINKSRESVQKKYDELFNELEAKGMTEDEINAEIKAVTKAMEEEMRPVYPEPPPLPTTPPSETLPPNLPIIEPPPVIPPPIPVTPEPLRPVASKPLIQPEPRRVEPPPYPSEVKGGITVCPDAWMGTWDAYAGGKAPNDVKELERYVKRVGDSQGRNTLAYAYAESLLKSARLERPARAEAEKHRDEVREREEASRQVEKKLATARTKEEDIFAEPKDKEITKLEKEVKAKETELEEAKKKASLGKRFADGVKNFFKKFKRENAKKEKVEESSLEAGEVRRLDTSPEELERMRVSAEAEQKKVEKTEEKKPEKPEESAELNEFGWKPIKEKTAPAMRGNEGINEFGWVPEKAKKEKKLWGFIKERAKGLVTGGMWEYGRATAFGLKTRGIGKETAAQAELLKQEQGLLLDPNEAWNEALEVEEELRKGEKLWQEEFHEPMSKETRKLAVLELGQQISGRNVELNKANQKTIKESALRKLEDKLKNKVVIGKEYMKAHGGKMITPEQMKKVEEKLDKVLDDIANGQVRKDLVNFGKLYRESLDDKWWLRYVYGALEGIGVYAGWKYGPLLYAKYFGGKVAETAGETVIKDTIWGEAKRMLIQEGIASPSNPQIQQVALEMAKESGVKVISQTTGEVIWQQTAAGVAQDTALAKGFILKLGAAKKAILAIKAVL